MTQPIRTVSNKLTNHRLVQIPAVIIEEQDLIKNSRLSVMHGKNHTVMIVMPEGTKLSSNMQERISILVNEKLD